MPIFFTPIHAALFECIFSLLFASLLNLFIFKYVERFITRLGLILGLLQLGFFIAVVAYSTLGYRLQVEIALPYIQEAVDSACFNKNIKVDEEGFYISSGFQWENQEQGVDCYYNNVRWICDC